MQITVQTTILPTYTVAHEFIVHHVNGNVATLTRPGFMTRLMVNQAKHTFAKRSDVKAIEISTVDNEGGRRYFTTINASNTKREKPVVAAPLFNVAWRKVGGLTFIRLGRLSLSFCLTRKAVRS